MLWKRLDRGENFSPVAIFAAFSYYVTAGRIDTLRTLSALPASPRGKYSLRDRRKREDFYDVQSGLFPVRLFLRNAFRTLLRLDRSDRPARRNRSAGYHGGDGCHRSHGRHRPHGCYRAGNIRETKQSHSEQGQTAAHTGCRSFVRPVLPLRFATIPSTPK